MQILITSIGINILLRKFLSSILIYVKTLLVKIKNYVESKLFSCVCSRNASIIDLSSFFVGVLGPYFLVAYYQDSHLLSF